MRTLQIEKIMTTTVKIFAHMSSEKEVHITVNDNDKIIEEIVLQDGESAERSVFDDRKISVMEVLK